MQVQSTMKYPVPHILLSFLGALCVIAIVSVGAHARTAGHPDSSSALDTSDDLAAGPDRVLLAVSVRMYVRRTGHHPPGTVEIPESPTRHSPSESPGSVDAVHSLPTVFPCENSSRAPPCLIGRT